MRRVVAALMGLLVLLSPSTAFADPAGPTDYRSEILSVDPPVPGIGLAVLGGDSFVELTVEPGIEVVVVGYNVEDYLWFRADGTVLENQNSPSKYENDDRFGSDRPLPSNATPDATPDWEEVATGGRYSWHDHRAHWMQTIRPFGKDVGDRIVEGVIPLIVDGEEVGVTVISTWMPEPSPLPAALGGVVAGGLVAAAFRRWRARATWSMLTVPIAVAATVAGIAQYTSLPSETGPRIVWVALPLVAMAASIVGMFADTRRSTFVAHAAALVVGVQLLIWGFVKRDGLGAAIVPTSAPDWFDRLATSGALAGGVALTAFALWTLFAPSNRATGTSPNAGGTARMVSR